MQSTPNLHGVGNLHSELENLADTQQLGRLICLSAHMFRYRYCLGNEKAPGGGVSVRFTWRGRPIDRRDMSITTEL